MTSKIASDSFVQGFLLEDLDIRGAVVILNTAWKQMTEGRHYAPAVLTTLGETTAVTALIGANLKQAGRLTFQVQGHGPLSMMVVDCDARLRLRGMAHADAALSPAPLRDLLGDGKLLLTLQTETAKQPYQSIVPLEGDSIRAIFSHYLSQSEQLATDFLLTANATVAAGLFLQALPGAAVKDADGWNRVQLLANTVKPEELSRLSPEELLTRLFPEETVRLFDAREVTYECPRDEEKVADMLRSLGQEEVQAMLEEHGILEVKDDICNQRYRFDAEDIAKLFESAGPTLH